MALKFVVGYWGRIWGAELLCGRVERKSTARFDWSGLLSLSGQQCFCGDINFKRHMLFSWYRIVSCLDYPGFVDLTTLVLFSIWQCA